MSQPERSTDPELGVRQPADLVCDLCGSRDYDFLFSSADGDYIQCRECRLIYGTADDSLLPDYYDHWYNQFLGTQAVEPNQSSRHAFGKFAGFQAMGKQTFESFMRSRRWRNKALRRVRMFEQYRRTGRLLEVGCGHGDFLKVISESGWNPIGVELSDAAACYARDFQGLDVLTGTVETMSSVLPQGEFDVIWAANLLEHVVSPDSFLSHVRKLLAPGGVFIGSTLNFDSWSYRLTGSRWQYMPSTRLHRFVFSPDTLDRYCEKHGLDLIHYTTSGFKMISKYADKRWFTPFVRIAESGVAAVAQLLNQGHRISIVARRDDSHPQSVPAARHSSHSADGLRDAA